jgi:histidine triad (HIT) family protein
MYSDCLFCAIAGDGTHPTIAAMDDLTLTLIHRGQWDYAHFLVAPRQHVVDVRDMDDTVVEALMCAVTRVAQAIDMESPGEQIGIWKSASHAAARHVHFHVHPRRLVHIPLAGRENPHDGSTGAASRWRMRLASIPVTTDRHPATQQSIAAGRHAADPPGLAATATGRDFVYGCEGKGCD